MPVLRSRFCSMKRLGALTDSPWMGCYMKSIAGLIPIILEGCPKGSVVSRAISEREGDFRSYPWDILISNYLFLETAIRLPVDSFP